MRAPVRPARLIPFLLGAALLVPLTWCFVRVDGVARPVGDSAVSPRETSPAPAAAGLAMPIAGVDPRTLRDDFLDTRGGTRRHGALDIPAPRGTPVLAAADGVVWKLFTSARGGRTIYEIDHSKRRCYYYAHLDGYAAGLHEGQVLRRGERIGYVGSTGNAREDAPHLHFGVSRLDPGERWWGGTPIDPFPLLVPGR